MTDKESKAAYMKQWRAANKLRIYEYNKKYIEDNKEQHQSMRAEYRNNNRGSINAYAVQYYADNQDARKEYAAKYRQENRAERLKAMAQWRQNNPDKQRAAVIKWRLANPDADIRHRNLRRARKRGSGGALSKNIVSALLDRQDGKCIYCAIDLKLGKHLDHKTPLSRGGSNTDDNVQLTCPLCNMRKHAKTHEEYLQCLS